MSSFTFSDYKDLALIYAAVFVPIALVSYLIVSLGG
jgi:hypothetical protein